MGRSPTDGVNVETLDVLRALQEIEKRAERVHDDQHVISTYVETGGLVTALFARDNGVVYGRRGTGKTHALRYLAETERQKGNFVVYVDVDKDLGSTEGLYADPGLPLHERATRLLVDVLGIVHTALLEDAFAGQGSVDVLDRMIDHFSEVLVADQVEREQTEAQVYESSGGLGVTLGLQPTLGFSISDRDKTSAVQRTKVAGVVRHRVHFGAVSHLMQEALEAHPARRCWLLFRRMEQPSSRRAAVLG